MHVCSVFMLIYCVAWKKWEKFQKNNQSFDPLIRDSVDHPKQPVALDVDSATTKASLFYNIKNYTKIVFTILKYSFTVNNQSLSQVGQKLLKMVAIVILVKSSNYK